MRRNYEVVYNAAPIAGRINEDSYYYGEFNGVITLAIVDGATPRLSLKKIEPLFPKYNASNGATFASRVISTTCAQNPLLPPEAMMLKANHVLHEEVASVYGSFSAKHILEQEAHLQAILTDERSIRLALPAAAATIVQIQVETMQASFAHAGDTYLFAFEQDGYVAQLTDAQMQQHDQAALNTGTRIQRELGLNHFADAIVQPQVKQHNLENALFHNYVDLQGNPDPALGVGVINGMPELSNYIQTGTFDLAGLSGILLATDGAILPSRLNETQAEYDHRTLSIRQTIEAEGLAGYLRKLRQLETEDALLDTYPRFKLHDDATAIYFSMTQ